MLLGAPVPLLGAGGCGCSRSPSLGKTKGFPYQSGNLKLVCVSSSEVCTLGICQGALSIGMNVEEGLSSQVS